MVKPSSTMQPEAVDLRKAGRSAGKSFQEDSFRNYMARKIDLQRKQFGVVLPPPPDEQSKILQVVQASKQQKRPSSFDPKSTGAGKKRRKKGRVYSKVLKRLERRHGGLPPSESEAESRTTSMNDDPMGRVESIQLDPSESVGQDQQQQEQQQQQPSSTLLIKACETTESSLQADTRSSPALLRTRPDLFLLGVCVMVNGYTNPDAETLQRLLHKHGGNLEKYETSRVTHIIAEHLSSAKANIYKRRRNPLPVVKPSWILDCVNASKLLPHGPYLIDEVRETDSRMKSISAFFTKSPPGASEESATLNDSHPSLAPQSPPESSKPMEWAKLGDENKLTTKTPEDSNALSRGRTDDSYINGRLRTVGTDPNFLETFFNASRLSFIGSFKQRTRKSPSKADRQRGDTLKLTPRKRFVLHVDMDSFFASVVLRNYPEYRNRPVAISHHGKNEGKVSRAQYAEPDPGESGKKSSTSECATCNYEARKYGIKKGMFLGRAKQLCPSLVVLPYDFEGYEEVSEQVADILVRYSTKFDGCVEQVSCDESYVELLLEHSVNTDSQVEELAGAIRSEIFQQTRCTASIGIAPNKLLAKLATDKVKPDGMMLVTDHVELLRPLHLRELHGVGYRLDKKLESEGLSRVTDVWDLGDAAESELTRILGSATGRKVFLFCHGQDDRPIAVTERKTIGAECNYGVRFDGPFGIDYMIEGLAKEVERRMDLVGVKGTAVTLKVKQRLENAPAPHKFLGHGICRNLSKSRNLPSSGRGSRDHKEISQVALALFKELGVDVDDVRGVGVTVSKIIYDGETSARRSNGRSIRQWFDKELQHDRQDVSPQRDEGPSSTNADVRQPEQFAEQDECVDQESNDLSDDESKFDMEIPPLNQLRLSQVECLPSPLRRQAMKRISEEKCRASRVVLPESRRQPDPRFRQTDVKRMLKLVAVKSGSEKLTDPTGCPVSLTQLDNLPLETQLQIVNDDSARVGALDSHPSKMNGKSTTSSHFAKSNAATVHPSSRAPKKSTHLHLVSESLVSIPKDEATALGDGEWLSGRAAGIHVFPDDGNFFRDNIIPLKVFLDENPETDQSTLSLVESFLCLCVKEWTLADIVVLLRSIKNRTDRWSGEAFHTLMAQVNKAIESKHGMRLDIDWVNRDLVRVSSTK